MNKLIHIGFGNIVNAGKIIAVVSPDSAPVKRMVQKQGSWERQLMQRREGRQNPFLSWKTVSWCCLLYYRKPLHKEHR